MEINHRGIWMKTVRPVMALFKMYKVEMLMAWIRVVEIRDGQNLNIFFLSSQHYLLIEYERDIRDESKIFILSILKNGVTTQQDRKDFEINRFGREDQEHWFLAAMKTYIIKL